MPKRRNEERLDFSFLSKRLKVLEKELNRHKKSASVLSSPSASTSCSSSSSSSSSSSTSRSASPSMPAPEYQVDRDAHALEGDVQVAPPNEPSAGPSHAGPVVGPPITGRSVAMPPAAGPSIDMPIAGPSNSSTLNADPSLASVTEGVSAELGQAELLDILGEDPTAAVEFGEEISKDVASRFEHVAITGLEKQARKELLDRYLVPSNCKNIAAPRLNAEIKAALTENVLKRDQAIEFQQKSIAAAIASLGRILSSQMRSQEKDSNLLKQIMDTGRLLCDLQNAESIARRSFTLYLLKKDFREQLSNTKIDEYLFGADLAETLKTAKAVSRSVTDIKFDTKSQKQRTANSRSLNWKAGPAARRQPPDPPPPPPAAPASRPRGTSSRKSSHHRSKPRHRQ